MCNRHSVNGKSLCLKYSCLVLMVAVRSLQEADRSYKCLDENNYDREKCQEYFQAYKECKKKMVSAE